MQEVIQLLGPSPGSKIWLISANLYLNNVNFLQTYIRLTIQKIVTRWIFLLLFPKSHFVWLNLLLFYHIHNMERIFGSAMAFSDNDFLINSLFVMAFIEKPSTVASFDTISSTACCLTNIVIFLCTFIISDLVSLYGRFISKSNSLCAFFK